MGLRELKGTYVFDVVYDGVGEKDTVTFESEAWVSVWHKRKTHRCEDAAQTERVEDDGGERHGAEVFRPKAD